MIVALVCALGTGPHPDAVPGLACIAPDLRALSGCPHTWLDESMIFRSPIPGVSRALGESGSRGYRAPITAGTKTGHHDWSKVLKLHRKCSGAEISGRSGIPFAGAFSISRLGGSRRFGRTIALWGFNRFLLFAAPSVLVPPDQSTQDDCVGDDAEVRRNPTGLEGTAADGGGLMRIVTPGVT
jgi:hypothetical protein